MREPYHYLSGARSRRSGDFARRFFEVYRDANPSGGRGGVGGSVRAEAATPGSLRTM